MSSGIILNTYIATPIFKDTIDVCRIRLEYMFCFRNRNEYARIDFVPEIVYADDWRDDAGTGLYTVDQERNHVFEVGGPIPWSMYYYPSTEKIDRSTQFGAVGYIITLYSSKGYVKVGVSSKFWGGPDPRSPVVAPML